MDTKQRSNEPARRTRSYNLVDRLTTFGIAALALLGVELLSREGMLPRFLVPAPSEVYSALHFGLTEGTLLGHLFSTLSATIQGFLIAALAAFIVASALVLVPRAERIFFPFVVAFQAMPKIALAPLLLIWFGFAHHTKVLLVVIVTFFPILVNALEGLRVRERAWLELMDAIGANKWQTYIHVRVPGSAPFLFTGLSIGVVYAGLGAVVAEFVGSTRGLGVTLLVAQTQFNVPLVFGILLLLMGMGLLLSTAMRSLQRRVVFWSKEQRVV